MASNPPFQVEDQTDEDFFDKLVNDVDYDVGVNATASSSMLSPGPVLTDGDESDEIKAFANLSISEADGQIRAVDDLGGKPVSEPGGEVNQVGDGDSKEDVWAVPGCAGECNGLLESANLVDFGALEPSNSFEFASAVEGNNANVSTQVLSNGTTSVSGGSGGAGVKELEWSAFNTYRAQNDNTGFGSYSDFLSELGENAGESNGSVPNNNCVETTAASGNQLHESAYMQTSNSENTRDIYTYGTDGQQTTGGQDQNSIEYMESLYPGWKIDPATGQWYQVDGYNLGANVQEVADSNLSGDWTASAGKTDVSYLQNSVQSVTGTVAASGTASSVTNWNAASHSNDATGNDSNWNQASQVSDSGGSALSWNQVSSINGEYPPHMVFDPQYPGWYYDTNAKEWRSLENYNASLLTDAVAHSQIKQNETNSRDAFSNNDYQNPSDQHGHVGNYGSQGFGAAAQDYSKSGSFGHYNQQGSDMWQHATTMNARSSSDYGQAQQLENSYEQNFYGSNHVNQQIPSGFGGTSPFYEKTNESQNQFSAIGDQQNTVTGGNFSRQFKDPTNERNEYQHVSGDYFTFQNPVNFHQPQFHGDHQFSHASQSGRSSAGRPPCALVTFGFGGKLIVAKGSNSVGAASFGSQNPVGSSISILKLMDVVAGNVDASDYFRALCRQAFPGPLTGGSPNTKELNKWIDERISNSESPNLDYRKGEVLRLLLSLLKISVQYQGKLRSPFGADPVLKENEAEAAVAKLFAASKMNGVQFSEYGSIAHCLQWLPSEGQIWATASEVQRLLVSGRKKEALHCAQEGQLWGPALVLAAQLGDQFYVETVKQMALRQLVAGSPLRTLCLLIAGQPADVFTTDASAISSMTGAANITQQQSMQFGVNPMLNDWKENLAVITANRTKDDELVLIHLGDCLWKENSDVVAAHMCYLVAEANFEPYSDTARFCLVGADHWKLPRTYASPDAIQRTEIYEYSKVLGNPQYILLPFQPYKLVYAHMLVEVGRVSDGLKYCQAVLKSLKNGRSAEVETLRQLVSSLEDRIKSYQQGGFSTNLAPVKFVGKLLNLFDSTARGVVGGLPPVPSTLGATQSTEHHHQLGHRVSASQSTMAMSSLIPSTSMEPISDGTRKIMHNRSVSEPDFGRTPRQDQVDSSKAASSPNSQGEISVGGTSRFSRFGFGTQLIQKTVGLVLKPLQGRQAKLGDENKFYYDEQLKTWVEKGAEPPATETTLGPPPTAAFQNGTPDYSLKTALKSEGPLGNGSPEFKTPTLDQGSRMPPLPPTSNQFSARARTGVRSRYVDTFNKGGGNQTNLYQSPSISSIKPSASGSGKFFVPTPISSTEGTTDNSSESTHDPATNSESTSISSVNDSFRSPPPSPSMNMQRFGSVGSISTRATTANGTLPHHSRRTASWSGSFPGSSSPPENAVARPLGEVLNMPHSAFMPGDSSLMHSSATGGSFGEELQEVEL